MIRALGFGFAFQILLFVEELGTRTLEVPRLMIMVAMKGCILVIQGLCPMEISNLEIDLI